MDATKHVYLRITGAGKEEFGKYDEESIEPMTDLLGMLTENERGFTIEDLLEAVKRGWIEVVTK